MQDHYQLIIYHRSLNFNIPVHTQALKGRLEKRGWSMNL